MTRRIGALLALFTLANVASAQDRQLSDRLDRPTFVAVSAIIDSARVTKLPIKPLEDKALEGAAKGSDSQKIILAVQLLSLRMGTARGILSSGAGAEEIKLGAEAIESGVSVHDLARLQAVCGRRETTMPLFVLNDLIAREVPVATATDLVLELARSKVKDPDLMLFQRNVRADIDRGADPTVAASTRARGLVQRASTRPKP